MSEVSSPVRVEENPEVYEKRLVDLILEKDRLERKLCVVETEIEFTIKYLKSERIIYLEVFMGGIRGADIGQYSHYLSYLWKITSRKPFPKKVVVPNDAWSDFINGVWGGCNEPYPEKIIDKTLIKPCSIEENLDEVVIGFSGGSDSTVCALRLLEVGKKPILFHLKGLTPSNAAIEYKSTQKIADKLGVELYVQQVSVGKNDFVESPVRNIMVLSMIIDFMIEDGSLSSVMMGNQSSSRLDENGVVASDFTGVSDTIQIYNIFVKAIKETFPSFRLISCVEEESTKFLYLWKYYPEYAQLASPCLDRLSGAGDNNYHKRLVKDKYKVINIPPNLCLTCYKCCAEYLILEKAGFDFIKVFDKEGLIDHCYRQFRKKLNQWGIPYKSLSNDEIAEKFDVNTKYIKEYRENPESLKPHLQFYEETGDEIVYHGFDGF